MKENDELSPFLTDKEPNREITKLYCNYREPFLAFVHKNFPRLALDKAIEIYHESFTSLYENIKREKLTSENLIVPLKTYLFSIGKHKLYDYFRGLGNTPVNLEAIENLMIEDSFLDKELKIIIRTEIMGLGEPCNRILILYYYERKSLKKIAKLTGYKSEQVAKNKRFSCMELLKKRIKQRYNKEDFF